MRTATTLTVLMLIMLVFPTEAKAQTVWQEVSSWAVLVESIADEETTTPKNIKLVSNIRRDDNRSITVDKTVTLDLNGHKIYDDEYSYFGTCIFDVKTRGDLTITDLSNDKSGQIYGAKGASNISNISIDGEAVEEGNPNKPGKVTLAAGTIGGPYTGVALAGSSSFTMTGGTINTENYNAGTGVDLAESSSFTMSGGTITGNSIGVNIRSNNDPATMTVSGNVNISGNKYRDVSLAYVFGHFSPIYIGGNLSANARIGVSTGENASSAFGKTFTSGLSSKGSASNFFVNEPDLVWNIGILPKGNELCFAIVNQSSGALQFLRDNDKEYAVLDCNYTGKIPVNITQDYYVERGLVYRNFNTGIGENAYSTLMLPFAVSTDNLEGISAVYSFNGVDVVNGKKAVTVNPKWEKEKSTVPFDLSANTPYLVKMNSPTLGVEGGVTLNRLVADPCVEKNDWCLRGTLGYIKWTDDTNDEYYDSKRASEIGSVYGFAASSDGNVSVGEFVKVESGASIKPFRAYLQHISNTTRGLTRGDDDEELPDRMSVIVRDSSSETGILKVKSEKPDEAWYALDGRQLNGKPSMKGVYINGGRKVVIK